MEYIAYDAVRLATGGVDHRAGISHWFVCVRVSYLMPGCSPVLACSEHVENFIGRSRQARCLLVQCKSSGNVTWPFCV